jgi:chromosome segregation ATPase
MKVSCYALVVGSILLLGSALAAAQTVAELVDSIPALTQESLVLEQEKDRLEQENAIFMAADQDLLNTYQTLAAAEKSFRQRGADLADQKQTLDQEISEYNSQCEEAASEIPATGATPADENCLAWEPTLSERSRRLTGAIDRYNQELARHQAAQARYSDMVMSHDAQKEALQQAAAAFPERLAAWWVAFDEIRRSGAINQVDDGILEVSGCSAAEMAGFLPKNQTDPMPLPSDQVRRCLEIILTNAR